MLNAALRYRFRLTTSPGRKRSPFPISPRELGLNADERKLGIGLVELRVEAVGQVIEMISLDAMSIFSPFATDLNVRYGKAPRAISVFGR
jgi:hypothetical protein